MIAIAFRELVSRRVATALAAGGLLTATLGFVVLASTSTTTEAVLTGDIGAAWSSPYDILIRPPGAATSIETNRSLVRPNFLSASSSGITLQQLAAVRAIPGVAVAAPIAVVGVTQVYSLTTIGALSSIPVDLAPLLGGATIAAFRITPTAVADGGRSRYPMPEMTVVVAPNGTYDLGKQTLTVDRSVINCLKVLCFGGKATCPTSPSLCASAMVGSQQRIPGLPPGRPGASIFFPLPLTIVGVDPVAENELSGLNKCVTSGKYLQPAPASGIGGVVSLLLSDRTLLDESISVAIAKTTAVASLIASQDPSTLGGWQPAPPESLDPNQALQTATLQGQAGDRVRNPSPIWMPGPIRYIVTSSGSLAALTSPTDPGAYANPFFVNARPDFYMPVEAQDVWFRNLMDRYPTGGSAGNFWNLVGRFNPECLPSFNANGAAELATFVPPTVTDANGKTIGPSRSIAGFLDSPPLMVTNLEGAEYFSDPAIFNGAPGPKFISAIRVRVAGTQSIGPGAEARLSRVAAQIRDATDLQVDIVKGSSPLPLQIALPAGKFGRPALTVSQGWASKGVAFRFLQAVSLQNLAIFAVVLISALVLIAQTAYVSVRRRRSELAVLRALGWPPWRIALLIELEMLILGLSVGVAGLVIGLPVAMLLHLGPTTFVIAAVVPLSVLIVLSAGLIPALGSMRGTTISAMNPQERIHQRRLASSPLLVGLRQAFALRWDVGMGIGTLALGATLFAVIELIAAGFRGELDTTLLGTYLSGQVKPFHFVIGGLTLAVGAVAVAQVITLAYLERRKHLATLRALGWSRSAIARMLFGQAMGMGIFAGLLAVAVTVAAGMVLSASPEVILGSGVIAFGAAALATAIAAAGPLSYAYAANPAAGLRGE